MVVSVALYEDDCMDEEPLKEGAGLEVPAWGSVPLSRGALQ